jgi:hypothetical protein
VLVVVGLTLLVLVIVLVFIVAPFLWGRHLRRKDGPAGLGIWISFPFALLLLLFSIADLVAFGVVTIWLAVPLFALLLGRLIHQRSLKSRIEARMRQLEREARNFPNA